MNGWRRLFVLGVALALAVTAISVGPRALHGAAFVPVAHGQYASSAMYSGQLHVFEWDSADSSLEHLWWNGVAWQHELLDGSGGNCTGHTGDAVGLYNSAAVYNGQLNDFYYDTTATTLRHAWWNGSNWGCETLDGAGGTTHAATPDAVGEFNGAIVYGTQLHDFYFDPGSGTLRHIWWNGAQWAAESLDVGETSGNGAYNAPVVYNGALQDFYYDKGKGGLRHAWWTGGGWRFEFLDGPDQITPGGTTDNVGNYNSSIIYNGQLHDFYYDQTNGNLRHAWWNGVRWTAEEVDGHTADGPGASQDYLGDDTAVTIYNGQLQVFYDDNTNGTFSSSTYSLRHAWYNGGWTREFLDGTNSTYPGHDPDHVAGNDGTVLGQPGSSATQTTSLIYNGQLQSFTLDSTANTLAHEWWNGAAWGFETLP